ncbi:MFS transporter [Streptomyces tremellae]|uniref:MFS transporter n=1 Tax=Streptomyces tremellae TaxID=1124239 RepID=A0ABP7DZW0_9ACTN
MSTPPTRPAHAGALDAATPAPAPSLRGHRSFQAYWLGEATALAGSSVSAVALPVIAAMELDATPGQVSMLASTVMAPGFLLALPAGVAGDRCSKKRLMMGTDLAAAAVVAVVPACWAAGTLSMPVLYCVALLLGALTVLHQAAAIAIVPELVEPHLVPAANAQVMAAFAVAGSAGTYGGTAAVSLLGAARCLLLDSASYLISAWCASRISTIRTARHPAGPRPGMITSIREGIAHVLRDPLQRPLVLTMAYHAFAEGIVVTYFAYYLLTELHYGSAGLGLVLGAVGAGSLVGALVAGRLVDRIGPGAVLLLGFAAYPICGTPILLARSGHGWLIALGTAAAVQAVAVTAAASTQRSLRTIVPTASSVPCPADLCVAGRRSPPSGNRGGGRRRRRGRCVGGAADRHGASSRSGGPAVGLPCPPSEGHARYRYSAARSRQSIAGGRRRPCPLIAPGTTQSPLPCCRGTTCAEPPPCPVSPPRRKLP